MDGGQQGKPAAPPDVFTSFVAMFEEAFGLAVDREKELKLTLRESLEGGRKEVSFDRLVACATCSGTGAGPGAQALDCTVCYGEGTVDRTHRYFSATIPCPSCNGKKRRPSIPCTACASSGRVLRSEKLFVKIPPGVEDGYKLRLGGKGNFAMDGSRTGDYFLILRIDTGSFTRRGDDVVVETPITPAIAERGGRVKVATLEGEREIVVRPGSHEGDEQRIPGAGPIKPGASAADPRGRGDIIAKLVIREAPIAAPDSPPVQSPSMPPAPQVVAEPPSSAAPTARTPVPPGIRVRFAIGLLLGLVIAVVGVLRGPRTSVVAAGLALAGLATLALVDGRLAFAERTRRLRDAIAVIGVVGFCGVLGRAVTHVLRFHVGPTQPTAAASATPSSEHRPQGR